MSQLLTIPIPFATVMIVVAISLALALFTSWLIIRQLYRHRSVNARRQLENQEQQIGQIVADRDSLQQRLQEYRIKLEGQQTSIAEANVKQELLTKQETQVQQLKGELKQTFNQLVQNMTELEKYKTEHAYLQKSQRQYEMVRENLIQAEQTIETLKIQREEQNKRFEEKQEFLIQQETQMQRRFENLANQILEIKGKQFSAQQNEKLNALLEPFKNDLANFKQEAEKARSHETEKRGQLTQQLQYLTQLNQQLSQDAKNLTKALKSESKIQGVWGEMVLEKVLESVGLTKGKEYKVQVSFHDEDKHRKIPDALVYLPEDKVIIIDAKTSLKAYTEFCNAPDEATSQNFLQEHIQSVENHIKELAKKDYANLPDLKGKTLDMALMFIPIEGAFSVMFQHQASLCNDAFEKRIFIVSPTTLFVSLYAIKSLWNMEDQAQNVRKIADGASKMLDKFIDFTKDMETIGTQIEKTRETHERAWNRLGKGRGNLISQARKLQELGVSHKKEFPQQLQNLEL